MGTTPASHRFQARKKPGKHPSRRREAVGGVIRMFRRGKGLRKMNLRWARGVCPVCALGGRGRFANYVTLIGCGLLPPNREGSPAVPK
jgi:hypothetical protein